MAGATIEMAGACAKSIALEMRSSTAESGENVRASAAIEVEGIINDVRDLLNTKFHNKYLFGGRRIDAEPFIVVDGSIEYRGDNNTMQLRVGPTRFIDVTVTGSDFMVLGEEERISSAAMSGTLSPTDLLDDLPGLLSQPRPLLPLLQHPPHHIGQKAHEDVRLDPIRLLVPYRPEGEVVLVRAER